MMIFPISEPYFGDLDALGLRSIQVFITDEVLQGKKVYICKLFHNYEII